VKEKFLSLFDRGLTPKTAMKNHVDDLNNKHMEDAFRVLGDRACNPDANWVYRLHASIFWSLIWARNVGEIES